ncbi:rhodanese-like domain-containing protein [Arsukibacterium sp.]|uniref:rhodanese-like domain-containing protein n=1 Tax=Arsukibacterium sp. TaxID=1977258 RepID=UPI002FDA9B7B
MAQYIEFISNNPILSLLWLVIFVLLIGSWIKARLSPITQLSPTQLTLLVNREDATVLDIRGIEDYKKGHITGARHADSAELQKQAPADLEKQKDAPIIVVCQVGMTAQKAAAALMKQGFTKVSVLQGGMGAWTSASLPVVKAKR